MEEAFHSVGIAASATLSVAKRTSLTQGGLTQPAVQHSQGGGSVYENYAIHHVLKF